MRAVDTNVLVRLVTLDEPKQAAAARSFVADGAWISHLVLVEAVWVLVSVYGRDRKQVIDTIDALLSNQALTIQEPETVAAALKIFSEHKGVGFSDCLILSVARKHGNTPLGTFDAKLARLDQATLVGR